MEKRREFNEPLYLLFLDYEKAYDQVNRNKLWETLDYYKIELNLINAIKSLYQSNRISIKTNRHATNTLQINEGLRQGCGLSPLLFIIYMNRILEKWLIKSPKGINLSKEKEKQYCLRMINY